MNVKHLSSLQAHACTMVVINGIWLPTIACILQEAACRPSLAYIQGNLIIITSPFILSCTGTLYRDIYLDAMNWWDVATDGCITFHAASKNETDYLLLTKDEGG